MTVHVFILGYVQGVGYRYFVKKEAEKLALKGWVCNTQDGGVEALFEGPKEKIEEIIKELKKGPFLALVKDVQVEWSDKEEGFPDFKIII